ncbi:hypothetical protein R5H32_20795 [Defluviimonas sp. D31]|uniref:hypothetical protein n=1 Tax=Defluviimonas sp. D31 TaxID=3083253 RepID=UPI00296E2EF8|nr:hypothetical protein [Defluviimonas sp. D31]MDW4551762.1 hypothetical protein [Defluviimonas sp. D31]
MGYSVPKPPLNLAEFLSQKGTPYHVRKPRWKKLSTATKPEKSDTRSAPPAKPDVN